MKDTELLNKLLMLQGLKSPESEKFIAKWINDTKIVIAKDSVDNIGFGNALKSLEKYIKRNEKEHNGFDGMLKTSKRGVYIFTNSYFAIKCKSDLKMPVIDNQKEVADKLLAIIDNSAKANKKKVPLPTRADLDAIIKIHKATPKESRDKYPMYDFGKNLPRVNAEYLFDLLPFFQMQNSAYVGNAGTKSYVYINFSPFEAVLCPISK